MSSAMIQLLILAGIAVFLIMRLRSVLGTREGFEKPPVPLPTEKSRKKKPNLEVIEGGADADIIDHVKEGSKSALALAAMKAVEPDFNVTEFLNGARGAYEMILMGFEKGDLASIRNFLSDDVAETFEKVIDERTEKGLSVDASFVGVRELVLSAAEFDKKSKEAEITMRFVSELTSVVKDAKGKVVEGNPNEIKRQKDVWTFARHMGSADPNWQLVATGG